MKHAPEPSTVEPGLSARRPATICSRLLDSATSASDWALNAIGHGQSALFTAISSSNTQRALNLINMGVDVNVAMTNGMTPLNYAICRGETEIAKRLIQNGADKKTPNQEGRTPLYYAINLGNTELAKYLIENGVNQEMIANVGTPLHLAIYLGNTELVKYLIDNGADIEEPSDTLLPLLFAIRRGETEIAEHLIDKGANIDALDEHGNTALHLATSIVLAKYLINRGANIEALDKHGRTPLHVATSGGLTDIAEWLIKKNGANIEALDERGRTPLHRAICFGHTDLAKYLIDSESNVGALYNGRTPLHAAITYGNAEMLKHLLLSPSTNVNSRLDAGGNTALHLVVASQSRYTPKKKEAIKTLLNFKPNLNMQNNAGLSVINAIFNNLEAKEAYNEFDEENIRLVSTFVCSQDNKNPIFQLPDDVKKLTFSLAMPEHKHWGNVIDAFKAISTINQNRGKLRQAASESECPTPEKKRMRMSADTRTITEAQPFLTNFNPSRSRTKRGQETQPEVTRKGTKRTCRK